MQRAAVLSLPLILVAACLTGCGLFGGSSRLDDALEVVPGSADRVIFVDRAAIAERLEVDDIETGADGDEVEEYVDAVREFPFHTQLTIHVPGMQQDAPFSDLDVEWEVSFYRDEDGLTRAWKMQDELDLDLVGDELVDDVGFEEHHAPGEARSFSIDLSEVDDASAYLAGLSDITVVPDEHLVIAGPDAVQVLDVVADDADSAIDSGHFEDLVDRTDDIEVATLARGDQACALHGMSKERLEQSGVGDLGRPQQSGFFVHGDEGDARSVLAFGDEKAAEEDATARATFLEEGTSPISGVPYSEFGDWQIETDGDQVRIDIDYDEPDAIPAVISRGDYLSICGPE